jgi:CRISPR/Cas system endoribonuclease Cas6 (RAMP superfamily)
MVPPSGSCRPDYTAGTAGHLISSTLTGSADLMQVGWECGLGEKNSAGFGMVDLQKGDS